MALSKALDEAWSFGSMARAEGQWHDVAKAALSQQTRFEIRALGALGGDRDFLMIDTMCDAAAFANSLRVSALAACNESAAAHQAAADGTRTIERLTGGLGISDIVQANIAALSTDVGTPAWDEAFSAARSVAAPQVLKIRQREAAVATRTAPLAAMEARGFAPRDWLAAAREESEAPILVMIPQAA